MNELAESGNRMVYSHHYSDKITFNLGYDKKINCYCESTLLIYKQLSGSGIGD
jgi:hypothetical protein